VQLLEQSGLFDEQFYRESNLDVADAELSPLEHFLRIGSFEGRRPNPLFDPAYYLTIYPEVAKAGVNPALHYYVTGALEGHNPSPDFGLQQGLSPLPPERYERNLKKLERWATARHKQAKLGYRPLVSVLMPTYNTQPVYLEVAVRSVIAQAYPNWELRIVDDGSSNIATLETLDRIAAWDKRIFVLRSPKNRGISGATNDALQAARGEYVAMLDHDD
jgi:hypothetical protein